MGSILPVHVWCVHETQIRLVDERRRLDAVTRALAGHTAARDLVELPIDERNQPFEGRLVAVSPLEEQPGDRRGIVAQVRILIPFMSPFSTQRQRGVP